MRRRVFLKTTAAGFLSRPGPTNVMAPASESLQNARALVASGRLGRVSLCRIPNAMLTGEVEFVLGSPVRPIFDFDAHAEEIVLLGSEATLAIGRAGLRLFSGKPQS